MHLFCAKCRMAKTPKSINRTRFYNIALKERKIAYFDRIFIMKTGVFLAFLNCVKNRHNSVCRDLFGILYFLQF